MNERMTFKENLISLRESVMFAEANLFQARKALTAAECDIQNHVYTSLEEAEETLSNLFWDWAHEDCEGAGNCGSPEYSQDFIVDGIEYTATETFEYNRHDRTYYYIDGHSYSYKEKA